MADQQAGWYPDPSGDVSKLRYWDGSQWTNDFTDAQSAAPAETAQQAAPGFQQPAQPTAQPVQPVVPQAQPVQPQIMQNNPYDYGQQYMGSQSYMQPPVAQSNGAAIAALICGIVGLCVGPVSIGAIIAGAIGMKKPVNKGMAIAGLVMGIIGAVGWLLYLIFFFPAVLDAMNF